MKGIRVLTAMAVVFSLVASECLGQAVQSKKRGICENKATGEDLKALSPGVSWGYNWFYKTEKPYKENNMEFYPMVWGAEPKYFEGFKKELESGIKPAYVLVLNEPNLKEQAFITPEEAADFWKKVKALTSPSKLKLVGPHMALGSSDADSIKAYDPLAKKELTYTYMIPYLDAFYHFAGKEDFDYVAVHSYGDINELRWMIEELHKKYGKPIWVTEFAWWGAKDDWQSMEYMIQAVELFESTPYIEKYAWFKADMGKDKLSLLTGTPGELTRLGKAYVKMPVHDPEVFYAVPGRVEAESYLKKQGMKADICGDKEGFLEMGGIKKDDWIDYNLDVRKAGTYSLTIRMEGGKAVDLEILSGDKSLAAAVEIEGGKTDGWRDVKAIIPLKEGKQTLRLKAGSSDFKLNWLDFK